MLPSLPAHRCKHFFRYGYHLTTKEHKAFAASYLKKHVLSTKKLFVLVLTFGARVF